MIRCWSVQASRQLAKVRLQFLWISYSLAFGEWFRERRGFNTEDHLIASLENTINGLALSSLWSRLSYSWMKTKELIENILCTSCLCRFREVRDFRWHLLVKWLLNILFSLRLMTIMTFRSRVRFDVGIDHSTCWSVCIHMNITHR